MLKAGPDRKYTVEFGEAAVRQVLDGDRSVPQVARSLEMSDKTLANGVMKARKGQPLIERASAQPVRDGQAERARLRQENARLKLEKEILEKAAAYFAKESCEVRLDRAAPRRLQRHPDVPAAYGIAQRLACGACASRFGARARR
jgi:transposase